LMYRIRLYEYKIQKIRGGTERGKYQTPICRRLYADSFILKCGLDDAKSRKWFKEQWNAKLVQLPGPGCDLKNFYPEINFWSNVSHIDLEFTCAEDMLEFQMTWS